MQISFPLHDQMYIHSEILNVYLLMNMIWSRGYKTFFMLNSAEAKNYTAHYVKMHFNIYEQYKLLVFEF